MKFQLDIFTNVEIMWIFVRKMRLFHPGETNFPPVRKKKGVIFGPRVAIFGRGPMNQMY